MMTIIIQGLSKYVPVRRIFSSTNYCWIGNFLKSRLHLTVYFLRLCDSVSGIYVFKMCYFPKHIHIIFSIKYQYIMMRCAIRYHLHNLKKVKNTHEGVLLLVACNYTKRNSPPWVFFTFFKLCEWYQIAQNITYVTLQEQISPD